MLHLYPNQSALALPQIVVGAVVAFGTHDRAALRASTLPFVALLALATALLTRTLTSRWRWAALAAAAAVASPLVAIDATSYMSDVPYLALEMGAFAAFYRWRESRRGLWIAATACVLATVQRQFGILLAPVLLVAVLLEPGRTRRDIAVAAAGAMLSVAMLAGVGMSGIAPAAQGNRLSALAHLPVIYGFPVLMFAPGTIGLSLLPLLPLLFTRRSARPSRWAAPAALALLPWAAFTVILTGGAVLPGNLFSAVTFANTPIAGSMPHLIPGPLMLVISAASVAVALALVYHLGSWSAGHWRAAAPLLAVAATQLLTLVPEGGYPIDRYFMPVAAPLVPLAIAAVAPIATQLRFRLTVGLTAIALVGFVAGEQDYAAWQAARDAAARAAYRVASPTEVFAGYEADAVYADVPNFDRTGRTLSNEADTTRRDFDTQGPEHPRLIVEVVSPSDPRPGYSYWSLAPGKLIVVQAAG